MPSMEKIDSLLGVRSLGRYDNGKTRYPWDDGWPLKYLNEPKDSFSEVTKSSTQEQRSPNLTENQWGVNSCFT